MKCPFCQSLQTKVIDSRMNQSADMIRRRRGCTHCEGRFTTYERVEEMLPAIIKKDGRREAYSRHKVLDGLQKACQKRPVTTQQIEKIASDIEKRVQGFGAKEIPAKTVGNLVMSSLHDLDKVAYIRFSSVYREFKDVEEFVAELQENETDDRNNNESLSFPFVADSGQPDEKGSER